MAWNINFTKKASKQLAKLPSRIQDTVEVLVLDLGEQGALPKKLASLWKTQR
jgi:mRNA-degrading endonuclease RelE of RelBE toxin-antitoxin system